MYLIMAAMRRAVLTNICGSRLYINQLIPCTQFRGEGSELRLHAVLQALAHAVQLQLQTIQL